MKNSGISWTHHTFNPWIGCTKASEGCANCYAKTSAENKKWAAWGKGQPRPRNSDKVWAEPISWNAALEKADDPSRRLRVFCMSMGDIFDAEVEDERRDEVFELIDKTPRLDWLLLTKRPGEAVRYYEKNGWPKHAWIGTSVELQKWAFRAETIKKIPAPVRFLSMEPLLGPVTVDLDGIDWVIVGGESGPNFRSMPKHWVLHVQRQCREAKVPFFFKQWASARSDSLGHELNGEVVQEFPTPKDRAAAENAEIKEAA
jgi:protein gp37